MRVTAADLEAEVEYPEPFEYESKDGQMFVLKDPKSLHFTVFAGLGSRGATGTFEAILGENYDRFAALPEMDWRRMDALMTRYNKHFGLGEPGESDASSDSLTDTAGQSKPTSHTTTQGSA